MTASVDGERQAAVTRKADGRRHVARITTASDQRGPPVDHPVKDLAQLVIARMRAVDDLALEPSDRLRTEPLHAERGAQRTQELVGLFDGRVVGSPVDHMQRPAVACAGVLGDREPGRQVVTAPNQAGRHGYRGQLTLGDRRDAELLHQGTDRGHHPRCAGPVDVVVLERVPVLSHTRTHAGQVERAVLPEQVVRVLVRLRQELIDGEAELGRGLEVDETEPVHEHQAAEPVPVGGREACPDRAAQRLPDEHGRLRAGAFDEQAEPFQHALGVQPDAVCHDRGAVARQVRCDHPMGRDEIRDHPQPVRRVARRPMQEDERWTLAPLEQRGPHAGQGELALGHGEVGQQPLAIVVGGNRTLCRHVVAPSLGRQAREPSYGGGGRPSSLEITNFAAPTAWSFLTTRRFRRGRERRRTRSPRCATARPAWRRCSAGGGRPCTR